MAIGVTVGLLALLGVGFGSLALHGADASASVASDSESIFKDSVAFREEYGLKNNIQEATEPPISSSEASRPKSADDYKRTKFPKGTGSFLFGAYAGKKVFGGDGVNGFNWGLLIGLLGGAFVVYKVLE